jgi:deazaflavin-dependent oxidoreductase (nitroreductase family)
VSDWMQKTIADFHAQQGKGIGPFGDHLVLMTARGAKSGKSITTPLVYGRDGDNYVVVASKGGYPQNPMWLGNLRKNPEVEVEVANNGETKRFEAKAKILDHGPERDRLFAEMTKIWPSFADYQKRTERVIPVVILEKIG